MVFNSLTFLVFFAVLLVLHRLPFSWTTKKVNLLLASYVFYAAWNPPFILLLWASTIVDWFIARGIYAARDKSRAVRRSWLVISVAVNIGFIGFFKYGAFLMHNWQALDGLVRHHLGRPGVEHRAAGRHLVLYVRDALVHARRVPRPPEADRLLPELRALRDLLSAPGRGTDRAPDAADAAVRDAAAGDARPDAVGRGPDRAGPLREGRRRRRRALECRPIACLRRTDPIGFVDAWLGTLAFSGQIFCDFAGYSTIAVGVALCLGFALPDNFRMPYAAIGFSDFWRRWHISLSTWLRDYLYIPLGGNRGTELRTYVNLMLTMLLGGLWHGANWTFVVWGGLHGLYLAGERWIREKTGVVGEPVAAVEPPRARAPHVCPREPHLGVLPGA